MSANNLILAVEAERIVPVLKEAAETLDREHGEAVLDFSSVRRINSDAVRALQDFVRACDEKAVKIAIRGVNVDVYKVLKLVKLTQRVSFLH
jgi:anti-anti-sigma regulatory factor